jgi:uncharacterized protein
MWIACDYAGRFGALAILAAFPSARVVAFERRPLQMPWAQIALWILVLMGVNFAWEKLVSPAITAEFPGTRLGWYPKLSGPLYLFDIVFGLALVAYHEEILFRRFARHAFCAWLGDGYALIITTSLIFAAYHWWSGIANIALAFVLGLLLMIFYRRTNALWPVVTAHYLVNVVSFAWP